MSEFGSFQLGLGSVNKFSKPLGGAEKSAQQLAPVSGKSFTDTLSEALGSTNDSLKAADKASQDFSAGRSKDLHDLMITMEKAELSLKTLNAVRSKMVESYQEIMRMQV